MNMLESDIVRLRALEPEDVDILYKWENDTNVWKVSNTVRPVLTAYPAPVHRQPEIRRLRNTSAQVHHRSDRQRQSRRHDRPLRHRPIQPPRRHRGADIRQEGTLPRIRVERIADIDTLRFHDIAPQPVVLQRTVRQHSQPHAVPQQRIPDHRRQTRMDQDHIRLDRRIHAATNQSEKGLRIPSVLTGTLSLTNHTFKSTPHPTTMPLTSIR